MRPIRPLVLVAVLALPLGALALGWREGRRPERADDGRPPVPVAAHDSRALTEEAIRLYAAGQFPRACERFSRAADDNPASAALRADVGNCFEGWGWQALREGRPDEALLLFRQGLAEAPESTALWKGLGLAAVHAGRPDDAFGPLERVVGSEFDPEVRMLLAYLYDYRDDPARAITHLNAVLEREPGNAGALRLLEKVERERRAESGFHRDVTPRFVLKYRSTPGAEARPGQRHPGRNRGARRRRRSRARADGLRPGTLDRAGPARPGWHGDGARAAGPAGRGRHPRRRDAPRVWAAARRDRIAVAPPAGRVGLACSTRS